MTETTNDDLLARIAEAEAMEYGPTRCGLLEELVRLADLRQDIAAGYKAREALVQAANFSGFPEKMMPAFSWCLSQSDKHPDKFPAVNLHWKYKWIIANLTGWPQITRQQLDDMLEDMRQRYERAGYGAAAVLMLRWKRAMTMGDVDDVKKYYLLWKDKPRDRMSDCAACVQNQEVRYAVYQQEYERAVELAAPILAGEMKCAEVPKNTYGRLMYPLVRLGRLEEAASMHRIGYRLAAKIASTVEDVGDHIRFLALTDNLAKATRLFDKHFEWALQSKYPSTRFWFWREGLFLMERLLAADTRTVKLRLPTEFPLYQEKGHYAVVELHAWLNQEARDLAGQFDRRNGNTRYTSVYLDKLPELHAEATAFPVK